MKGFTFLTKSLTGNEELLEVGMTSSNYWNARHRNKFTLETTARGFHFPEYIVTAELGVYDI